MKRCSIILIAIVTLSLSSVVISGVENIKPIGEELHVVLIPGSGASNGVLTVGRVTPIAHATGHKYYFKEYGKLLTRMKISYSFCLKKEDKDSRTLVERSEECVNNILQTVKKRRITEKNILLIGHSMGGNIARLVASNEELNPYLHSILTISTPHKGTILADYVFEQYYSGEDFETPFYRWIIDTIDFAPTRRNYIKELTIGRPLDNSTYLPQDVAMANEINYYSISNYMRGFPSSLFFLTWKILDDLIVDRGLASTPYSNLSDGVIPTYAMVYGEHLGTVQADHAEGLCLGSYQLSPGCNRMMKLLVPVLKRFKD